MLLLYTLAIRLYVVGIRLAALFHPKARQWVAGRAQPLRLPQEALVAGARVFWLHAASLGEFEQGRPLLETVRRRHPDWRIVLTFFSPSGYEMRKHYDQADWVGYLPPDVPAQVRHFLDEVKPDVAVFVKYEFWANYLFELQRRGIPTFLVSALFRSGQPFFHPLGTLWRRMLRSYSHLFLQDQASARLLESVGITHFSVVGDTRVDRVLHIAAHALPNEVVQRFAGTFGDFVLVAGSTWERDERLLADALHQWAGRGNLRLIVAPHDPSEEAVRRIMDLFPGAVRYSQMQADTPLPLAGLPCLIIDNVGLLNTLYRYGSAAYIGGGLGKGIHNTLEPAAWRLPVAFGPRYEKFEEARQFVARGGATVIHQPDHLRHWLMLLQEPSHRERAAQAVLSYLEESRGATERVMAFLEG